MSLPLRCSSARAWAKAFHKRPIVSISKKRFIAVFPPFCRIILSSQHREVLSEAPAAAAREDLGIFCQTRRVTPENSLSSIGGRSLWCLLHAPTLAFGRLNWRLLHILPSLGLPQSAPQHRYHQERNQAEHDIDELEGNQQIVAARPVMDQAAAPGAKARAESPERCRS